MNQTLAAWLLIGIAFMTANLPFLSERIFGVIPFKHHGTASIKPFWLRFGEVVCGFLLSGAIGMAFESTLGNRFSQTWEFYAITFALYLVLAYPGFVYRYLFRRPRQG